MKKNVVMWDLTRVRGCDVQQGDVWLIVFFFNTVCRLGDGKEYLFQAKDEVRDFPLKYHSDYKTVIGPKGAVY